MTKIRFILFDWGGTLGKSGKRHQFVYSQSINKSFEALDSDTLHTLKCLAGFGLPMGILSNTSFTKEEMNYGLEKTGLDRYFTVGLYSSDPGMCSKPCNGIFRKGYAIISTVVPGIRPEEILYVGDNYIADVYGAHSFGFKTAYMTGQNSFKAVAAKEIGFQTFILNKLSDLCNVIHAFNK